MMNGVKVRKISAKDIPRIAEIQESITKKGIKAMASACSKPKKRGYIIQIAFRYEQSDVSKR
jgi:hypothetical protein